MGEELCFCARAWACDVWHRFDEPPPRPRPLQNAPPNVLANASCWALHMGISSNLRYQMLNGLDMVRAGGGSAAACWCGCASAGAGSELACSICSPGPVWLTHAARPLCLPSPLQVLQPRMPSGLFRLFTSVVRGVNNAIGGISFVVIAKVFGVQKAAEPAAEPAPAPAAGKKKSK